MNKLKFLLFISVIVFFVAVIVPLRLEAYCFIYLPNDFLDREWNEARSDYESAGLYASKPVIRQTPFDGMKMHGERVVNDNSTIVTEKWVPYKPEGYHYITISIIATGYGEVSFELNGQTQDLSIGNWTSEPIKKAVRELYQFKIKEANNVINTSVPDFNVAHIQPTKVDVSATGKALTRSQRVTTYGSRQEARSIQASSSGVGFGFVIGTSSYWKWTAGITRTVPADSYNGSYSIETNDTAWSQIYYNSIFTDGNQSTFVSGETVRLHLKTEGRYRRVDWYISTPDDIRNGFVPSYWEATESYRLISNNGYTNIDFTCPGETGTYEVTVVIVNQDKTVDHASYSIVVGS